MKKTSLKILIVEDDALAALTLKKHIEEEGHDATHVTSGIEAQELLTYTNFDIAFVDLDLESRAAGFQLVPILKKMNAYTVILTGNTNTSLVEKGYDLDCDDYLIKPFSYRMISRIIQNYIGSDNQNSFRKLVKENFITQDEDMLNELDRLANEINSTTPIFLSGPTGCGKTTLAKLIHLARYGTEEKYLDMNVSAFSRDLIESELFGHVKGSFSGANNDKVGKFTEADGGTLFLDEVTTMTPEMQKKILTAIEQKAYYPVGSNKKIYSNFRLISATGENVFEKIKEGTFRTDLFFRISGINIHLKPLSERKGDIPLFLDYIQQNFGEGRGLAIKDDARRALVDYDWPGNVRELFHFFDSKKEIKKAVLAASDLPDHIRENEYPNKIKGDYRVLTKHQIKMIDRGEISGKQFIDLVQKDLVELYYKKHKSKRKVMLETGMGQRRTYDIIETIEDEKCLKIAH